MQILKYAVQPLYNSKESRWSLPQLSHYLIYNAEKTEQCKANLGTVSDIKFVIWVGRIFNLLQSNLTFPKLYRGTCPLENIPPNQRELYPL